MGLSSFDTPRKPSSTDASGTTKYGVVDNSQIGNVTYEGHVVDYNDLPGGDKFKAASDKGGFSSGGCFIAGTKVKTPEGEKNIEDIKAGDEVYAYNSDIEETDVKKVLQTFVHESSEIAHVTISGETIDATTNHPFYVVGYGFIPAGELKAGDIILLLDGTTKEVESVSIEYLEQPVKVYNFEVEDWHTYYVSEQGVLVHNQCYTTEVPKGGSGTKDIYRAVGVDEYYDIMDTGRFRGVDGSLAAKEFGNDFNETLDFANRSINKDKVAIIKVTIPESTYNQLHHMNLDAPIFKSGTPVVEPEMLDFFNNSILNIEHIY